MNQIKQNFHQETENAINKQITMELTASYVYQSMAYYFDRDDVALPGFSKFFKNCSDEEREHAEKLMKYLNSRGGRIIFQNIPKPAKDDWSTGLSSLETALDLEKQVNQSLLNLHALASDKNDPHFTDLLESEFLDEQVNSIKKLSDMITKLKRAGGNGLGEYLFDKELNS